MARAEDPEAPDVPEVCLESGNARILGECETVCGVSAVVGVLEDEMLNLGLPRTVEVDVPETLGVRGLFVIPRAEIVEFLRSVAATVALLRTLPVLASDGSVGRGGGIANGANDRLRSSVEGRFDIVALSADADCCLLEAGVGLGSYPCIVACESIEAMSSDVLLATFNSLLSEGVIVLLTAEADPDAADDPLPAAA